MKIKIDLDDVFTSRKNIDFAYREIHIWRPLWGRGVRQNKALLDVGEGGGFAAWLDVMLSQTWIYHWQEIFLLTLTSDSEAIC